MTSRFTAVKGTRDLLPPESERFAAVEATARRVFSSYGYGEVRTPVLEPTELFARSVGETTDIVHKEMYTFTDRKGRSLTMRPENTAGVVRAIVQAGLERFRLPLRLWYAGPQFRYEQPQKGRYREFRQIGAELIGAPGPDAEAELLRMLFDFLSALGFTDLFVKVNCVGRGAARREFADAVRRHVAPREDALSADDRRRLAENPLRLFDSKDAKTREALRGAPATRDFLDLETRESYARLKELLDTEGIRHVEAPELVRGLDYYTGMVFEITSDRLGAQDAILGGGRYDDLIADLGGKTLPAVGFAIGEDRLVDAMPEDGRPPRVVFVVVPNGPAEYPYAREVAREIRAALPDAVVDTDLSGRADVFRKGFNPAARVTGPFAPHRVAAAFAVLLGEDERSGGTVTLRDLEARTQETFPRAELAERLGVAREA